MIAKPLEWNDRFADLGEYFSGCYSVTVGPGHDYAIARFADCDYLTSTRETLGQFIGPTDAVIAGAKAACERHHQKAFIRQMSQEARGILECGMRRWNRCSPINPEFDKAIILLVEVNAEESQ